MRLRLLPTICLCTVAAILAAAAGAAVSDPEPLPAAPAAKVSKQRFNVGKSQDLWATINVCDTKDNPNTIGIRGSMPGLRTKRAKLFIRFQVQYQTAEGGWEFTDSTADSGWRKIGRTRAEVIETGQDFTFQPPADGAHHLRGSVRFRWVRKGRTLEELRRLTEAGHRSTAGADPAGYSAATCQITPP